jgi:diguanylate cyclase (GGDEF)-like protein/putative nucleotidyltransferase with HDIG domain
MSLKNLKLLISTSGVLAAVCFIGFTVSFFSSSDKELFRSGLLLFACGLFCLLIFALFHLYARRAEGSRLDADERLRRLQEVADLRMSVIESLAIAIDAKDQTTQGHVHRTRVYSVELGKLLNVTNSELEALRAGALLHDIGKLAVPDFILNKPGKLSSAEFEKMKIHSAVGADIIRRVNFPYPVEDIVRFHHEKWDGTGYPTGLKGEQIPLVARIISVVDFYDSTRCERPYRAGMTREESLALLRRLSAKAFDPAVVESFVKNVEAFDALISESDLKEQVQSVVEVSATDRSRAVCVHPESSVTREAAAGFRSIADAQREVSALHEIAQTIGSSLNLQDTAALVTAKLRNIVPFDTCVVFALGEKSDKAATIHASGVNAEFFSERSLAVGEGITGWVIANARAMHGGQPELDLAGVPEEVAACVRSVISAPLLREDGAFGAITLYSSARAPYTVEHARLLETVCLHASNALSNALAFERTKASALTDSLTGLPNARALQMALEQRVAECRRLGREPLAVLSVDVDNFSKFNEEFGHVLGDRLLASVAEVVKAQLRQMDSLARYAGDEFVAILPTATAEVAAMVAERIRTAVESHKFEVKTARAVQVGVSVGFACFPSKGETADELILAATQDMRRNKQGRRVSSDSSHGVVLNIDAYR